MNKLDLSSRAEKDFGESASIKKLCAEVLTEVVAQTAQVLIEALCGGHKVLVFGNGGSAADAQHFAGELVGHFLRDRRPLPAIAFTTDTSTLTAIANDYTFDDVFARQVEALAQPGDVVIGISTSGTSRNVLRGIEAARMRGATTVGLTGGDGGALASVVDWAVVAPSHSTPRIQEVHITVLHILCALIEEALTPRENE